MNQSIFINLVFDTRFYILYDISLHRLNEINIFPNILKYPVSKRE